MLYRIQLVLTSTEVSITPSAMPLFSLVLLLKPQLYLIKLRGVLLQTEMRHQVSKALTRSALFFTYGLIRQLLI